MILFKSRIFLCILSVVFTVFYVETPVALASSAEGNDITIINKTPLFFSIQEGNENDSMARKALDDLIKRSESEVGRHIPLGIARIDLNEDGIKELFVRILDEDLFCEEQNCQVYGFAVTESGFIQIADLKARTIDVLDTKTNGTKDLLVHDTHDPDKNFIWNGNFYRPLPKEELKP